MNKQSKTEQKDCVSASLVQKSALKDPNNLSSQKSKTSTENDGRVQNEISDLKNSQTDSPTDK